MSAEDYIDRYPPEDDEPAFPPPPKPGEYEARRAAKEVGRALAADLRTRARALAERFEPELMRDEAQREYLYTAIRDTALAEGVTAEQAQRIAWKLLPLFTDTGETHS